MKKTIGKKIRNIRIFTQLLFLIFYLFLLIITLKPNSDSSSVIDYFFYFDPLVLIVNTTLIKTVNSILLLSLLPLILTIFLGRFFCGWICPFGTINHFISYLGRKFNKRFSNDYNPKLLKLKYLILIVILIFAVNGTNISSWLDPFSLLTRSTITVVLPSLNYEIDEITQINDKVNDFVKDKVIERKLRTYRGNSIILIIFLIIIILNFYKNRFFCNYLCPLGALYSLVSKFSMINLKTDNRCTGCNICSNSCTYGGSPYKDYTKSECMLCFNCVNDCPLNSVEVKFGPMNYDKEVSITRREFLGVSLSALFVSTLPSISGFRKKKSNTNDSFNHGFIRPPGSLDEESFLRKCVRCELCMEVCPTNFLQPSLFQTGIDGIWTPIGDASKGYCEYECNECTKICPTDAIKELTLDEKKEFKIGTAIVDTTRCYTYLDGYMEMGCAVCEEHCPIPDKAIRFHKKRIKNEYGEEIEIKQIYVVPDLCIGCGICEHVCPRQDKPGIIVTPDEENRQNLEELLPELN